VAFDTDEIVIAGDGDVYVAPVGTTAPVDASAAPAAAFVHLGTTNANGATITDGKTTEDVDIWKSFYPGRTFITGRTFRCSFVLRQWNYETVKLAFGGGTVTGSSPNYKYVPPDPSFVDFRAVIIDGDDGGRLYRWYLPRAIVVEDVETTFGRTAPADLPITLALNPTGSGDPYTLFVADAEFSAT
jgi:hypothetical protein